MEEVEGIILVLSCEKHKLTRLREFGPKQNNYNGWKVIKVIGNYLLDSTYDIQDDILYVKCEDTYAHLLKKLALSIKYLYNTFSIKQGVLRCGDDLIFNEDNLVKFVNSTKYDFYGKSACGKNYDSSLNFNLLKKTLYDPFMMNYYINHQDELVDKNNGMNFTIEEFNKYLVRPNIWGPQGVVYYISSRACNIIMDTMEKINYNIFHFDEFSQNYPYVIEDVGVTYIMYYNLIPFVDGQHFCGNSDNQDLIAIHTNKYK